MKSSLKVSVDIDTQGPQLLGYAARALELALTQDCASPITAAQTYDEHRARGTVADERGALVNLMACCLARLWEIR